MRLIDADALIQHTYSAVIDGVETDIIDVSNVDNAPTVADHTNELVKKSLELGRNVGYFEAKNKYTRPQGEWGKWVISEIRCPDCLEYFDLDCYSKEELYKCPNCGASMKPKTCTNCETFGKDCGDCEVGEDE